MEESKMSIAVFEQAQIAGVKLRNRIIRSATYEGMADENGFPTEKLKNLYIRLAKGGVGAIITGYAAVQADGKSNAVGKAMIDDDRSIPAYREITDAVHEYDTPIIMQISHCGRQTRFKSTGLPVVAPSALRDAFYNEDIPRELSESGIQEIIENFVSAIIRAKKAGFDGVELHLAHGYLLSEFLSSHSNRRKDRWGGSIENKYRIVGEIFKKAKERVGDYPILAKINAHDGRKNGMRIEEAGKIAQMLEDSGCAAIEVSCGTVEDGFYTLRGEKLPADAAMDYMFKYKNIPGFLKNIAKPVLKTLLKQPKPLLKYNLDAAFEIRKSINIPVIVVGGINNMDDINDIIKNKNLDFVSMSRPFIIEPDIVSKFSKGTQSQSKCIMCNYCIAISEEKPLKCYYGKLPQAKQVNSDESETRRK
jgi:2,4-dienoyl-CoA reductase-like NADH-dependent reductase (Old Yellow Enzyme family)